MESPSTATLYFRSPGPERGWAGRIVRPVPASPGIAELSFNIGGPATIDGLRLRLLTGDRPVEATYIRLYSLSVVSRIAGHGSPAPLIEAHDIDDIRKQVTLSGLKRYEALLGGAHVIDGDPSMEIRFPEPVAVAADGSLEVTLSLEYLRSPEFVVARDLFLAAEERMAVKSRELEGRIAVLEKAREELLACHSSPFWRPFSWVTRGYRSAREWTSRGTLHALGRLASPAWWSRRVQTRYEQWRAAHRYQNRGDS